MKKGFFTIGLLLFLLLTPASQYFNTGLPFISNYTPAETGGADQNWAVVQDQRGVMYFGNTDRGVLEYDGVSWRNIPVANNSIVRSLAIDDKGILYVGALGEFGHISPDHNGSLQYHSLSDDLDSSSNEFTNVWKIYVDDGKIYFCSSEYIYTYHPSVDKLEILENQSGTFMSFLVDGNLYHGNLQTGLMQQDGLSFKRVPGGEFFRQKNITCMFRFDSSHLFIGAGEYGAYLLNPSTGRLVEDFQADETREFFKESIFYQGLPMGDGNTGVSTLFGGFIVLNRKGEIINRLDKTTGLQDGTVLYSYLNPRDPEQSPLWMALNIGISKAELNSSFRYFDEKSGLSGSINDIIRYRDVLYVATSSGVYLLDETEAPGRFRKMEALPSQCLDIEIIKHPDTGRERLMVATISGLYEIIGKKPYRLDPGIMGKEKERSYYLHSFEQSRQNPRLLYLGGENKFTLLRMEGAKIVQVYETEVQNSIHSIAEDPAGDIWFSTHLDGIMRFRMNQTDTLLSLYDDEDGLPSPDRNFVYRLDDEIMFATTGGIYRFDAGSERFVPDTLIGQKLYEEGLDIFRIIKDRKGRYWISYEHEGNYGEVIVSRTGGSTHYDFRPFRRLPSKSTDAFYEDDDIIWIGKSTELYRYDEGYEKDWEQPYEVLIRRVIIGEDSVIFNGAYHQADEEFTAGIARQQPEAYVPSVDFSHNDFVIQLAAPFFENENSTQYRYWLEGADPDWSRWSERTEFILSNLRPRSYTFHAQARNIYGLESTVATYDFEILPPWYQTIVAYFVYAILLVLLVIGIVRLQTRRLIQKNIILERIIERRTAEIRRQKEELTDSIEYASKIQHALLPSRFILKEHFPEHLLLFLPRDIVSGDFYWMTEKDEQVFVVAADCTGHGVPGAFMSMLGISFLNELVEKLNFSKPDEILGELRNNVVQSLKQKGAADDDIMKDGMDLAVCVFDFKQRKLWYSGAYNPLFIVRPLSRKEKERIDRGEKLETGEGQAYNKEYILEQIKADRMPVGFSSKMDQPFTLHELEIREGYTYYMHSDGYQDQFGGPKGKKLTVRGLKHFLLTIQDEPMSKQQQFLEDKHIDWRGELDQIDDIILIGLRINDQLKTKG